MNAIEILNKHTHGEMTVEEANAELKKCGAGFHLDYGKNDIKPGEEEQYGLLDTGTGTLDKVRIENMEMTNADIGNMKAFCFYNGGFYTVEGKKLIHK